MLKHLLTCSLSFLYSIIYAQEMTIDSLKNKLPYEKYKGLIVAYVSFSPSFAFSTANSNSVFGLVTAPRIGYYLSKDFQILSEYAFSFQTFKIASVAQTKFWHQFAITGRYFPLKKHNYFFAEAGVQTGNYTTVGPDRTIVDAWSTNYIIGLGIETLPKKRKYVIMYDYRVVLPFNNKYMFDVARSLGLGVTIRRK